MKVEISNLGPVKKAEIDLKPLTVFIGQNGEGKSWTAYAIAALLGGYSFPEYLRAYLKGKTQQKYPPVDDAIEQFLEEGNAKIDVVKFASDCAENYFNDVARFAPQLMGSFMKSDRLTFPDLQMRFNLGESKTELIAKIKAALVDRKISFNPQTKTALLNAVKESREAILYFYSSGEFRDKLPERSVKEFVCKEVFQIIHTAFFASSYFLSPERTTIITLPFGGSIEKEFNGGEITEPFIEPVKQLLGSMSAAYQKSFYERKEQIKENPQIGEYLKLADFLESDILLGKLDFETSIKKELLFQPTEGNVKLGMPVVSSMVKELAPLVLYLRYLAKPNDLLIIDEPEMNLHPAVQVEIVEFLGMLVNANLKVLITTHSPYIVDQLVNLMKAEKHEERDKMKDSFYLESSEAFLSQKRVSVYLFDEGNTKNILPKNGIIDWETFSNVSEDVSQLYSQLLTVEDLD